MFKEKIGMLSKFKKIFVTGPIRSGTHIGADIIANELSLEYVSEERLPTGCVETALEALRGFDGFVFQCPKLFFGIDKLSKKDTCIVLMRRPIVDILDSRRRVGLSHTNALETYGVPDTFSPNSWEVLGVSLQREKLYARPLPVFKYDYWETHLRGEVLNSIEIRYEDLSSHVRFIPKAERLAFQERCDTKSTNLMIRQNGNYQYDFVRRRNLCL